MPRINKPPLDDLHAFLCVAQAGSFTRAAARLGVTQPALSQTVRALEERLQIRLLTRTTRSVSPTAAGQRLLETLAPRLQEIEEELAQLLGQREKPAGLVRITCSDNVLRFLVLPKLSPLLREYPDIQLEFDVSNGFRDIVADRFDAGIRLGEAIERDMIAVPIEPPIRMCAAATADYFARYGMPKKPRDLLIHNCINFRQQSSGGLYAWEFEKGTRALNVRVQGQVIANTGPAIVEATLAGLGIGFLNELDFAEYIKDGRLVRVLQDWCPPFGGHHLYYPSRRQQSAAFQKVLELLRWNLPSPPAPLPQVGEGRNTAFD